jgi:hypothetical protein
LKNETKENKENKDNNYKNIRNIDSKTFIFESKQESNIAKKRTI